jgi:hypothetical protein
LRDKDQLTRNQQRLKRKKKRKKKVSFEKVKHAQNSVGPQKPAKYSLFYFFLFARTLSCTQTDRQTERQTK